jgi:putative flavoprotein involved in K+ transport
MTDTDTVVVGAGHAGLAVSRLLSAAGRDHVVLERGRIGERWRSERWDSLRLQTPNWMTRLPGWRYCGPDPDGYLSAGAFGQFLDRYAASFDAPVLESAHVERVSIAAHMSGHRYVVVSDRGTWRTRHVVIATGPHGVPRQTDGLQPRGIEVFTARQYRNPTQLPSGGVLIVGASSSGVQIADELARAGRPVVLAVGRHTRMPRRYRGLDIFWWLSSTGRLARTIDDVGDPVAARREPSPQLVGRNEDLDLAFLKAQGVRLTGRLAQVDGGQAWFRADLAASIASAERRMHRLLDTVDEFANASGLGQELGPPARPGIVAVPPTPTRLDLRAEGIGTILLATGYRPDHPWLRLPVTAPNGTIAQHRGVTAAPGVYVVGQRFQHRRDSGYIDGARHNAQDVVAHLLGRTMPSVPTLLAAKAALTS